MRPYLSSLFGFIAFAFPAFDAVAQLRPEADSLVLERTRCFGTCPAYRLRVARDGSVDFQSRNPGDSTRAREATSPQTLERLIVAAVRADFFSLPARIEDDRELCSSRATDHPSVTITVFGSTTSTVHYYTGCSVRVAASNNTGAAPSYARPQRLIQLNAFANAIDSTLGSARWMRPAVRP
jgi:Domain of unknown function (DUF6438)